MIIIETVEVKILCTVLGCSSVAEYMFCMHKVLDSISSTKKEK